MTKETLYEMIEDINEQLIFEAKLIPQRKPYRLLKWSALAACLCLVIGVSLHFIPWINPNGSGFGGISSGFWGNGDTTLLESHRDDFTPDIDASILAQLAYPSEVKKSYQLLSNEWFLSDKLTDFSQVVTTDVHYISWCDEDGNVSDTAYSSYDVDENGTVVWDSTAYPSEDSLIPCDFGTLSYEMIETALSDITYEDYIITYSPRLYTIFIWVRGTTDDLILTYPSRPDFVGIESGGIYTLEELQEKLAEAYKK